MMKEEFLHSVEVKRDLKKFPNFKEQIKTTMDAINYLSDKPVGTFIVRDSSQKNGIAISFVSNVKKEVELDDPVMNRTNNENYFIGHAFFSNSEYRKTNCNPANVDIPKLIDEMQAQLQEKAKLLAASKTAYVPFN